MMAAPNNVPAIELRDVKKYFPITQGVIRRRKLAVKAVDGVSFAVQEKETYALVGESGSGKTTTANVILGLEQPTAGVVLANNQVISGKDNLLLKKFRTRALAVFQDPAGSLDPRMHVSDIIAEPLVINRRELDRSAVAERVAAVLNEVGLSPEDGRRFPHEFSGGQRQRIAIARALSLQPTVMVLDEPISALDVSIGAQIVNLLKDLQERHDISYFMIAHNLATVSYMADRVGTMYCGRLVETGGARDVLSAPLHPYTKALVRAATPQRLDSRDESLVARGDPASPLRPPSGCRYHPRCPFAMPKCSEIEPELRDIAPGRQVACYLC